MLLDESTTMWVIVSMAPFVWALYTLLGLIRPYYWALIIRKPICFSLGNNTGSHSFLRARVIKNRPIHVRYIIWAIRV